MRISGDYFEYEVSLLTHFVPHFERQINTEFIYFEEFHHHNASVNFLDENIQRFVISVRVFFFFRFFLVLMKKKILAARLTLQFERK